jgi:histidine triad (HIT) family protein
MTYDPGNIFARILRGEVPAHKVFEDTHTLAFMDVMPQSEGHTLVIPKWAAENLFDLPQESLTATILTTQRVARAVKKAFDAPGIMIAQLNGRDAGQSVFHTHFHIVPRYDGIDLRFHARDVADARVLAGHAARIRAALD